MDWQRVQHCADVYWPFYRLSRWFDRTAARSPDCRSGIYIGLGVTPAVHSYRLLVAVLVAAGLTSGTFYPLTLTFALRNIPPRFLPFTLALYASFVDGAVNFAPSLYGWYRDHLSWHWMFWSP